MARFKSLSNILHNTRGTSTVEYGIILGMIVIVIFVAMQGLATETIGMWNDVSTSSANAISNQ